MLLRRWAPCERARRTGHDKRLLELLQHVVSVLELRDTNARPEGSARWQGGWHAAHARKRAPAHLPISQQLVHHGQLFPRLAGALREVRSSGRAGLSRRARPLQPPAARAVAQQAQRTLKMRSMSACAFSFSTRPSLASTPAPSALARVVTAPRPGRCTHTAPHR